MMIKEIGKSGGDIFKFAGDAMIGKFQDKYKRNRIQNLLNLSLSNNIQKLFGRLQRVLKKRKPPEN